MFCIFLKYIISMQIVTLDYLNLYDDCHIFDIFYILRFYLYFMYLLEKKLAL